LNAINATDPDGREGSKRGDKSEDLPKILS